MPKNIDYTHMDRMFTFAFYDELDQHMPQFKLANPAFLLRDVKSMDERMVIYHDKENTRAKEDLSKNNLLEIETFGHVLLLDVCHETVDLSLINEGKINELNAKPLHFLAVQLFDSSDQPVFAPDVTEESIAQIPEVLWDDPNLLIAIVSMTEKGAYMGTLRIPERIEQKWFETVAGKDTHDEKPTEHEGATNA